MIINSITLDNFRSHKHTKIDLNQGISLILGKNGAGKSSIFEAISYSFFKTFTGKVDDIVRKPVDDNDVVKEMKVTVDFENDGNHYTLIRGKRNKTSNAMLYQKEGDESSLICKGDKTVTYELESILGLDSNSFLNAIYIRQGDITDLIEKNASERKEFIAKLLGIDDVEKSWEEMLNIITYYKDRQSENKGKLNRKDELEKDIAELTNQIKDNTSQLNSIEPELASIENEIKEYDLKIAKSDNEKNEFNNLNNNIKQLENYLNEDLEQKENIVIKLQKIQEDEKEYAGLKSYVDILPHLKELKNHKNELDNQQNNLAYVNKNIENINNNMKLFEDNREFYANYENVSEEITSLRKKYNEMDTIVKENQEIKIKLDEKKSRKDENLNFIRHISEHASKLFNQNFSSPEEVESKVTEEIEKTEFNINKLTDKINENNSEIASKETELRNYRKSLHDLENTRDTCPICQSSISHEKHEELSDKYNAEIENLENRIEALKEANKNQSGTLERLEKYREDIKKIDLSKLKDRYAEFNTLLEEIKELKKYIPEIEENKKSLDEIDSDIEDKEKYLKSIENKRNNYIIAKKNLENSDIEKEKEKENELNSRIGELKDTCRSMMIKYAIKDDLDRTIKYYEEQVDRYHQLEGRINNKETILKEKENTVNRIADKESQINQMNETLNKLDYDDDYNQKLHETQTSLVEKRDKIQNDITVKQVEIKKDKEQLEEYKNDLDNLKQIVKQQEQLDDFMKMLIKIREVYSKDGVQKELRQNARPDIEKETMDIFNEFDFDYSAISLDDDYNITVENKKETLNLTMMSGGEKIVIALALRLGIARVVSKQKTELLLLDEPTIHLDNEKKASLIDIIRQISIVPQMIVVTHDEEMEPISNNIIKIQKNDGISSVEE